MCATTALRYKKMESLSAAGTGWQVCLVGGLGEGLPSLLARIWMMSGDGQQFECKYHDHFNFPRSILASAQSFPRMPA